MLKESWLIFSFIACNLHEKAWNVLIIKYENIIIANSYFTYFVLWSIYNMVVENICQTGLKSNKRTWYTLTREKNISNHAFLVLYNLWYIYSYIGLGPDETLYKLL